MGRDHDREDTFEQKTEKEESSARQGKIQDKILLPFTSIIVEFKDNCIKALFHLLVLAIYIMTAIFAVKAILAKVSFHSFNVQLNSIKQWRYIESFTSSAPSDYWNLVASFTFVVFFVLSVVLVLVECILRNKGYKRVFLIIDAAAFVVSTVLSACLQFVLANSGSNPNVVPDFLYKMDVKSIKWLIIILFGICGTFCIVTLVVLIFSRKRTDSPSKLFKSILIIYIAMPVLLWIIENIIALGIPVLAILFFFVHKAYSMKCPICKKWGALQEIKTYEIGRNDISIKVENEIKDNGSNVTGTQEQYIPGVRITYQTEYCCQKCGATSYSKHTEDKKLV
jgi:hypothetical protein